MSCHVKVSILRALRAKLAFSYVVHEGPQMGLWGAFTFDFYFFLHDISIMKKLKWFGLKLIFYSFDFARIFFDCVSRF